MGGEGGRPAATATPAPPPSPDQANALRHNGQYDEAEQAFRAIAERGAPEQQAPARLALAQTLLEAGKPADAAAEAESLLQSLPATASPTPAAAEATAAVTPAATAAAVQPAPPVVETEAQLLLATARSAAGQSDAALQAYGSYLAAGGDASSYALMDQALLLAKEGRTQDAQAPAAAALAGSLAPGRAGTFMAGMAGALERAGDTADALDWWNRYFQATDDPSGLTRVYEIKQTQGDASWADDAGRIVSEYPRSSAAVSAVQALDAAGITVDGYDRAYVDYRQGSDTAARDEFTRYLATPGAPRASQAAFYLGAIAERAGDDAGAIDAYGRSLSLDPAGPLGADAHWWRGRLLEQAGRLDEAYLEYDGIVTSFPSSPFLADAVFRRGLVRYLQGRAQGALDIWQAAAKSANDPGEARRNAFWAARATYEKDRTAGSQLLQAIVAADGSDWYGLRAQAILYPPKQAADRPQLQAAVDWQSLDAWAAGVLGGDPNLAVETVLLDPHWSVGQALIGAGRVEEGRNELRTLLDAHAHDPAALYQLARRFNGMHETELAGRAATRLLTSLPDAQRLAAPADLYRIAYPVDWPDLLSKAQQQQKAPSLLMLALVRQESWFDPLAGSGAGALGLTQVLPSTARSIAGGLDQSGFSDDDLFRPVISLQFGASYLADQLTAFKGNFYYALAAYNGGPGTASDAQASSRGDPDLFVEQLEFDETRAYVKLVSENYARYRQLYAGLPQPELPAP